MSLEFTKPLCELFFKMGMNTTGQTVFMFGILLMFAGTARLISDAIKFASDKNNDEISEEEAIEKYKNNKKFEMFFFVPGSMFMLIAFMFMR